MARWCLIIRMRWPFFITLRLPTTPHPAEDKTSYQLSDHSALREAAAVALRGAASPVHTMASSTYPGRFRVPVLGRDHPPVRRIDADQHPRSLALQPDSGSAAAGRSCSATCDALAGHRAQDRRWRGAAAHRAPGCIDHGERASQAPSERENFRGLIDLPGVSIRLRILSCPVLGRVGSRTSAPDGDARFSRSISME